MVDVVISSRPARRFLGGLMFVTRVAGRGTQQPESWAVIGDDGVAVAPVERFLGFLSDVGRSPNTVRAYAYDLKDWFEFLSVRGVLFEAVTLDDVGAFVAWLRLPPAARRGGVVAIGQVEHCAEVTVNRKLSAVLAFYEHAGRNGVPVAGLLTAWRPPGRRGGGHLPFLHHLSRRRGSTAPVVRMRADRKVPRVLGPGEVQGILDGCDRLRDRLLFALLFDSGMRVGEALGMRHEDWVVPEARVVVARRVNANRARAKSHLSRSIPVSPELVRLYADYLHGEYGQLVSDYVFVNLWGRPYGRPLTYPAVYEQVLRLRRVVGVEFGPHWFRHTYATGLLRAGTPIEVVSQLLGHASVATTMGVYGHLDAEDAREALDRAGWLAGRAVRI